MEGRGRGREAEQTKRGRLMPSPRSESVAIWQNRCRTELPLICLSAAAQTSPSCRLELDAERQPVAVRQGAMGLVGVVDTE